MTQARTVGDYRLLRVIGEGGMGVVHLGLDPSDRAVAVKVVRPHVAADPETRARLAREVRSLLRVRHPRVAEVLDADFDAELPYVVMRYVPGEALDTVVRRDGPLTGDALAELAVGLFEAVAAVHAVGVVHRDLKPGNVLLLDGSPVVIDFGIARALDDVALTSTGLMVGTPGYLSPEVLDGTDVGTAADWWGWGAVVAFAATGRPPFRSGPLEAVWDRVRRGAVDLEGVPGPWARLLAATLRPDPADRPSPGQLSDEVARLTGRRPTLPAAAGAFAAATATAPTRTQPRPAPPAPPASSPPVRSAPAAPTSPATTVQARPDTRPPTAPAPVRRPAAAAPGARTAPAATAPTATAPTAAAPTTTAATAARPGGASPTAAPTGHPGPTATTAALPTVSRRGAPDPYARIPAPPPVVDPGTTTTWPVVALSPAAPGPASPAGHDGRADPGAVVAPRRPGGAPVRPLPRRTGLTLLGWLVVSAVAAVSPLGGAVVVLLWSAVARSAQWSRVAAAMSRARAGRLGAGARTALTVTYPFRLLGALAASAGYLLVGALVVSPLLLLAAAFLLRDVPWDSWTTVRTVLWRDPVPAVLVSLGALLAWAGPGGRAVRHGSRALTEPVARHRDGRLVLVGLAALVVVAAVLVVTSRL